jgi:hypothetical protein
MDDLLLMNSPMDIKARMKVASAILDALPLITIRDYATLVEAIHIHAPSIFKRKDSANISQWLHAGLLTRYFQLRSELRLTSSLETGRITSSSTYHHERTLHVLMTLHFQMVLQKEIIEDIVWLLTSSSSQKRLPWLARWQKRLHQKIFWTRHDKQINDAINVAIIQNAKL